MARVHGKDAQFTYNSVGISDELSNVTLNISVPEADITAFGDSFQNALAGKPSGSMDITGALDTASSQGHDTLKAAIGGGVKTAVFSPDAGTTTFTSTASGLTGTLLSRYRVSFPVGGASGYQATLQISGGLTHS